MENLKEFEAKGDYLSLIEQLRDMVAKDKRVFTDPYVKEWCGKRWRNLFLQEAVNDTVALKEATKNIFFLKDKRPEKQRIAERFLRGDNLIEWEAKMPKAQIDSIENTTLLFCPGLINGLLPVRAFTAAFPAIVDEYGWKIIRADIHPMRGCEPNADDIKNTLDTGLGLDPATNIIKKEDAVPPGDVFLMGYSKGAPDILAFLVKYPEYKDRIKAVITWAGAINGSFTPDELYETIKDYNTEMVVSKLNTILKMVSPTVVTEGTLRRLEEYDIKGAMLDLTTKVRYGFLEDNKEIIDKLNIPIFSFSGATSIMEVPHFQMNDTRKLNKYDSNNDMQLTQQQAKMDCLEMATHLATLHGHHWDLSYDPFPIKKRLGSPNLDHLFPKDAAIITHFKFLAELGLIN